MPAPPRRGRLAPLRPPPLRERLARQANEGDDAAELVKLAGAGTMRIIDVLTLVKHEDGSVHPSWPTSRSFPGSRVGRRPGGRRRDVLVPQRRAADAPVAAVSVARPPGRPDAGPLPDGR